MIRYTHAAEVFNIKIMPKPWRVIFSREGKKNSGKVSKETAQAFISLLTSEDIADKIVEREEA